MQISLVVQKVSFKVGLQKQDPIKAHAPHLVVVFKVHLLLPSSFFHEPDLLKRPCQLSYFLRYRNATYKNINHIKAR